MSSDSVITDSNNVVELNDTNNQNLDNNSENIEEEIDVDVVDEEVEKEEVEETEPFWLKNSWFYFWWTEIILSFLFLIYCLRSPNDFLNHINIGSDSITDTGYALFIAISSNIFCYSILLNSCFLYKMRPKKQPDLYSDYSLDQYKLFQLSLGFRDILILSCFMEYDYIKLNPSTNGIIAINTVLGFYLLARFCFIWHN